MNELNNQKGKKVVFAAMMLNILWGLMYMWSMVSKSLVQDLGWASSQASLPYTFFTISFVVAMIIAGEYQDKKGPRLVITIGAILGGTGIIIAGLFTKPIILLISIGVITGFGVGMVTAAASPPAIKWFPPEKKGLITGIVVAGTGVSSFLYSPLAEIFIKRIGVSYTLILIGIVAMVPSLFFVRWMTNPPIADKKDKEIKINKDEINLNWKEMLKDKNFYKLWSIFALSSSGGLLVISHVSTIADIQINWKSGFILVMLLAVFNSLGRFLGGVVSDKIGRFNFIKFNLILQLINLAFFGLYSNKILLIIGVAISGLCYGANFSVFPTIISDLYGMKHFGLNYGLMYSSWGVGGTIGPMVAAKVFDTMGNYFLAYKIGAILIAVAIFISFTIKTKYKAVRI